MSFSEHSFTLHAVSKFFTARTREKNFFDKQAVMCHENDENFINQNEDLQNELKKHKRIVLTTSDFVKLYFARMLGCFFPSKIFQKREKLLKLYYIAEERINKEMNMVKLIKGLRNIKILMKNSMMSKDVRFQLEHVDKNVINLDTSSDDSQKDTNDRMQNIMFEE